MTLQDACLVSVCWTTKMSIWKIIIITNNNDNNDNEFAVAFPRGGSSFTVSRSNWNLEVLILVKGGKPEYSEKNPRSRVENQQQTQPTYDAGSRNRTRATLVGGERSHHCAIPAPWLV